MMRERGERERGRGLGERGREENLKKELEKIGAKTMLQNNYMYIILNIGPTVEHSI